MKKIEIDISKILNKKVMIIIAVIVVGTILGIGTIMVTSKNDTSDVNGIAESYFYSYINNDWNTVYSLLSLPKDEQYITKEIFIDLMKANAKKTTPDIKTETIIADVIIENTVNEQDQKIDYVVKYRSNGTQMHMEFSIIEDDEGNPKVDSHDYITTDYKINIPASVDVSIDNQKINEKYRLKLLPEEQKYEVVLLKGIHQIIVKSQYGTPVNETIYVGVKDPKGTMSDTFTLKTFIPYETDITIMNDQSEEFVKAFFIGVGTNNTFQYSTMYYKESIKPMLDAERNKYKLGKSENYTVSNYVIKDTTINAKGVASYRVSFDLSTVIGSVTNAETISKEWVVNFEKDKQDWLVSGVVF